MDDQQLQQTLQALIDGQRHMAQALMAMSEGLDALTEHVQALSDAVMAEDEGEPVLSLDDGEVEGLERDGLDPL